MILPKSLIRYKANRVLPIIAGIASFLIIFYLKELFNLQVGFDKLTIFNLVLLIITYELFMARGALTIWLFAFLFYFVYGSLQMLEIPEYYYTQALFVFLFSLLLYLIQLLKKEKVRQDLEAENKFKTIAELGVAPLVLKNKKGEVFFVSESIKSVLGINSEKLVGKTIEDFVHPDEKEKFRNFYLSAIAGSPRPHEAEFRVRTDKGDYIWARNDILNLLEDKRVNAVVATFHNIDQKVRLDKQRLKILKREKAARREAEQAIKDRDEFLSIASHELKTPLTTILLQLQTTLRRTLTRPFSEFSGERLVKSLKIAEEQSQRLSILISDLLNMSLLSTGRIVLKPTRSNLTNLISQMIERHEEEIKISKSNIEISGPDDIIGIWDPVRIEQAVLNLLTNALKYGEGKQIEIFLNKSTNWAYLTVKDHGVGIKESDIPALFEPFKRGSENKTKGLGVGLFVARQIVRAHGGEITLQSGVGGAEFLMKLPLKPDVDQPK